MLGHELFRTMEITSDLPSYATLPVICAVPRAAGDAGIRAPWQSGRRPCVVLEMVWSRQKECGASLNSGTK